MELEAGSPGVGRESIERPAARERRRRPRGRSRGRSASAARGARDRRGRDTHSRDVGDHIDEDAGRDGVGALMRYRSRA